MAIIAKNEKNLDTVTGPIASGVTLSRGDLVALASNRFDKLATNASATGLGLCVKGGTGDAGGTVKGVVAVIDSATILKADYTATVLPGASLDIASGSAGLTTASNNDVTVLSQEEGVVEFLVKPARLING